jgi:hypothetical protein
MTHRQDLARAAAALYRDVPAVAGSALLARPGWLPSGPVPLTDVRLAWEPAPRAPAVDGAGMAAELRPPRPGGGRYASYADALGALDRPAVFENRTCYRLLDVAGGSHGGPRLAFGAGHYFDGLNTGEAVAHELARAALLTAGPGSGPGPLPPALADLPLRRLIGDPCDPARRPALPALSVLTVRSDRRHGDARMLLHWRDPTRVAAERGLFQVLPAGMFQPSAEGPSHLLGDFDLERCIIREASEDLLGMSERERATFASVDYDGWPFYQRWREARDSGAARLSWLGLGVDPLTLSPDLLVVAVIEATAFDALFDRLRRDDEGDVRDVPFTAEEILHYSTAEPMQPAGAALLRLAWTHRGALLAPYDPKS